MWEEVEVAAVVSLVHGVVVDETNGWVVVGRRRKCAVGTGDNAVVVEDRVVDILRVLRMLWWCCWTRWVLVENVHHEMVDVPTNDVVATIHVVHVRMEEEVQNLILVVEVVDIDDSVVVHNNVVVVHIDQHPLLLLLLLYFEDVDFLVPMR